MDWYRSWPDVVPEGRAYVHDSLPRLIMRDCNYATLSDYQPWPDGSFCMLEWDVALGADERALFAALALERPNQVLVAPYTKPYPKLGGHRQVHRVRGRPIPDGRATCQTFGFGCIYLPAEVLNAWWQDMPAMKRRFSDVAFSTWHHQRFGPVTVDWAIRPQHLHGD